MEEFFSAILFILPSLFTYFWVRLWSINPSVKYHSLETLGILALLWLPTGLLAIVIYNGIYLLADNILLRMNGGLALLTLSVISEMGDLQRLVSNLYFLLLFLLTSIFSGVLVAYVWSRLLYGPLAKWLKKRHNQRKFTELSVSSSVWERFFLTHEGEHQLRRTKKKAEEPFTVEIYYLANPNHKLYGSIAGLDRPFDPERSLILHDPEKWRVSFEENHFKVMRTYIDTESGLVINKLEPIN